MKHPEYFTVLEAADRLNTSRWTIWRLIRDGQLQYFTVRGRKRIHVSELRRYLRKISSVTLQDVARPY